MIYILLSSMTISGVIWLMSLVHACLHSTVENLWLWECVKGDESQLQGWRWVELSPDLDVLRDNLQTFMPIRGARLTPHSAFIESFILKPFLSPPTHQAQYCVLGIWRERRHRPFFKILKMRGGRYSSVLGSERQLLNIQEYLYICPTQINQCYKSGL